MRTAAAIVLASLAGALHAQTTRRAVVSASAGAEARLAADSFYRSAVELAVAPAETPARAARMWAMVRFAHRLAPDDPRVNRMLADICLAQKRPEDEAAALRAVLAAQPTDHLLWRRWMDLRLAALQDAESRKTFLGKLAARDDLAPALRAEAQALRARILYGQGLGPEALAAAQAAVGLDPNGPEALTVWRELVDDANTPERIALRLRILNADPRALADAWALGLELGRLGLHEQAMRFLDYARSADPANPRVEQLPLEMQVQYCNAMLDAGRHAQAVDILEAVIRRHPLDASLKGLLLEAYRKLGRKEKAEELIGYMAEAFEQRLRTGEKTTRLLAEQAWFYLDTRPSTKALVFARQAADTAPDSITCRRLLAAARMVYEDEAAGEKALRGLLGKDMYASVLLAEHYERKRNIPALREAILKAAGLPRSGPAYRRLKALAQKHGVVLPTPPGAPQVELAAQRFNDSRLRMFGKPGDYLAVEIRPAAETILCGDRIEIVAVLRNISQTDVPLGERGLLKARMALTVALGPKDAPAVNSFTRLPMVVWPAPRYLPPGGAVETSVRLDLGELADALARRPLEDLGLVVTGQVDPLASGTTSVPGVKVAAGRITRVGLLRQFDRSRKEAWETAWRLALGRVVRDLRRGDLPTRMRTARQTGALLAFASDVETGRTRPPADLAGKISRPVVLAILKAMLADRSAVVRQEVIASLGPVRLDQAVIGLLAPAVEDPSALVRARVLDVLAGKRTRGSEAIVNLYASDDDEVVRALAAAFQPR